MEFNKDFEIKTFFRLLVYVLFITIAIVSNTIVLHEIGHYVAGVIENCEGSIILYDTIEFGPYTQLNCSGSFNSAFIFLSPFLLLIPFAMGFSILKDFPEKYFSIMIIGLTIFFAGSDFQYLTGSGLFSIMTGFLGLVIYVIGQYLMIERTFIRFEEKYNV